MLQNPIPFGRGLGSSATAIAAGVVLANEYLDLRLTKEQLLDAALMLEPHPDNLSAAIWGGVVASVVSENGRSGAPHSLPKQPVQEIQHAGTLSVVFCSCSGRLQTL